MSKLEDIVAKTYSLSSAYFEYYGKEATDKKSRDAFLKLVQDLDTSHWIGIRVKRTKPLKYSVEELFCENSKAHNNTILKRLKRDKLIPYICDNCNNSGEWLNKPLTLHLDHINGKRKDNRLENLRFLCPNCHQQTETWGLTKNSNKIPISDKELFELSKIMRNYELARKFGVSPSTISKRLGKFYRS